jgi:DNA-binding response OmpR family regulator
VEAKDGQEALELFSRTRDFALVILDVMMPYVDGFEVCRKIREASEVPIVILTARDSEYDELSGFTCGADEYISKPFSPPFWSCGQEPSKAHRPRGRKPIAVGGLVISYREREVTVDKKRINLTPKEFELLHYMVQNRNIVLSRDQILSTVWDMDFYGDDRTVDTHIKCLRAKLGDFGKNIVTLRKVGYKFEWYG